MAEDGGAVKRLDEATAEVRRALFWFSSFAAYFVTTVAATTHEQLLRGTAVRLPILNVDLPIVGFYVIGPMLFLALHAYLLFQLYQLALCVREARKGQGAGAAGAPFGPSFPVTQYLLGGLGRFRPGVGLLLWLLVILLPIAALIFVQIRFLPYHARHITAFHMILVVADVVLIGPMWFLTIRGLGTRSARSGGRLSRARRRMVGGAGYVALGLVAAAAILFSTVVATLPADRPSEPTGYVQLTDKGPRGVDPCTVDPNELRPLGVSTHRWRGRSRCLPRCRRPAPGGGLSAPSGRWRPSTGHRRARCSVSPTSSSRRRRRRSTCAATSSCGARASRRRPPRSARASAAASTCAAGTCASPTSAAPTSGTPICAGPTCSAPGSTMRGSPPRIWATCRRPSSIAAAGSSPMTATAGAIAGRSRRRRASAGPTSRGPGCTRPICAVRGCATRSSGWPTWSRRIWPGRR